MARRSSRPAANRPGTSPAVDRPEGDAARRRLDLDHRLEPEQAARAGAHDLDREPAALAPRRRAPPRPCRRRRRGRRRRAGRRCAWSSADLAARSRRSSAASSRADRLAVEHAPTARRRRGPGSRPPRRSRGRRASCSPQSRPKRSSTCARQRLAAHRLAGLGAAELQHVAAGRLVAEVVIEVTTPCTSARVRLSASAMIGTASPGTQPNAACTSCRIGSSAPSRAAMTPNDLAGLRFVPRRHCPAPSRFPSSRLASDSSWRMICGRRSHQ